MGVVLSQLHRRFAGRNTARIAVTTLALTALAAPIAIGQSSGSGSGEPQASIAAGEGDALRGGQRNPAGADNQRFTRETQIIANTAIDTYGTRQSNLGAGGGAIYGCRSVIDRANVADPKRSTPCVRVNNLNNGLAFQFRANLGPLVGYIQAGGSTAPNAAVAPFATNATAIAPGLNADRVDGKHATEIVADARQKAGLVAERADSAASVDGFTRYIEQLNTDAQEVTLAQNGPLRYFARCTVDDGGTDRIEVFIESSVAAFASGDDLAPGVPVQMFSNSSDAATPNYDNSIDDGSASAQQDGRLFYLAIDGETLGLGLNVFGSECYVAGTATSFSR
jgi:hypothetical protein